jgi:hypothetical protein
MVADHQGGEYQGGVRLCSFSPQRGEKVGMRGAGRDSELRR